MYIATNQNYAYPVEFRFVPDCGAVCDMLYREIKRWPMIIGKPSTVMINYVTNKFKTNLQFTVIIDGWVIY